MHKLKTNYLEILGVSSIQKKKGLNRNPMCEYERLFRTGTVEQDKQLVKG